MKYIYIISLGFLLGFTVSWKIKPKTVEIIETIRNVDKITYKTRLIKKIEKIVEYRDKEVVKYIYVPPEGSVTIKPKDPEKKLDDVVEVKIKWYGLTFRPGYQVDLINGGFGLDSKLVYINRFGLVTGVSITKNLRSVSPTAGVTYRLDRLKFIQNTEAMCAYTPLHIIPIGCGLRMNW